MEYFPQSNFEDFNQEQNPNITPEKSKTVIIIDKQKFEICKRLILENGKKVLIFSKQQNKTLFIFSC